MSIRVVDPTCTECGKPLTDPASRAFRIGPECRKGMTTAQLRDAMARAQEADNPFRIPEERPASIQARVNNHNARAMTEPDGVQLCHHENVVGRCADCRREADPWRAAEMILRQVRAQPYAERRAERIAVQVARRDAGIPAPAARPAPRPSLRRAAEPKKPKRATAHPTGQLELL
ncbi:DUF6011 domain-containing protein [Actinomadura litoris]|uniref:Uncharacterized protein n=1 Tax=Actinomadura litoris TaxID=2678616 RepID=A0A7K1LBA2_9ACTN|nr:DUF6011 domain-containing protein [Actinomadura litoris]MUN41465.1 hypothetical protein [Actinomadura litoris]